MRGNPRRRPLPPREPKVRRALPAPPLSLSPAAREEWFRCGQLMLEAGMISGLDRAGFAAYCQSWANWLEATAQIQKQGIVTVNADGIPQTNPWWRIQRDECQAMDRLGGKLGLNPSERSRIHALTDESNATAHDPIAAFQARRAGIA